MSRPHYHLPLKPGTNVAVVTALAHVIVTEGLFDEAFIRERCDWAEFQDWAEFVSDARATARRKSRSCPACRPTRSAARRGSMPPAAMARSITASASPSTARARPPSSPSPTLPWLTGNIGRKGVGVNPLRGQNNVQGACDMGSFPHELPGYRHISGDATRDIYESLWGVKLDNEPGLRIPNMLDAAVEGTFKGIYIQGEDILQSDPDTKHVSAGLAAMECVVVHDLFLNETANYAHVFLPGSTFLEKDGTFTNAERRINRVRKVMAPKNGLADWEVTQKLAQAMGLAWSYRIRPRSWTRSPRPRRASPRCPTTISTRWARCSGRATRRRRRARRSCISTASCAARASSSAPNMSRPTRRPDRASRCCSPPAASSAQYNVGAQTRRTANVIWHDEDRLEIHPHDAENRGIRDGDWVRLASRAGETTLRALITDRVAPAWSTRPSTTPTRRPTSSPPTSPTGRPTAPNTR